MAIKVSDRHITLAVRDLLNLNPRTSKTLSSFPLPQRGMLGKEAQVKVQKQRKFGLFHHEYTISSELHWNGYDFLIQGRIDGVYELKNRVEVEEIKSVILTSTDFKKLHIEKYPEYSEQVLFYCYLLHREMKGMEISPYVILYNLINEKERTFKINFSPISVENLLFERLQHIIEKTEEEKKLLEFRQKMLESVCFDLPETRPQQIQMMQKVAISVNDEKHLMVSAPTGTGKTAGALLPAIKFSLLNGKRIFFNTSKNTQQQIVQSTLDPLIKEKLEISALFLRSIKNMCINDVLFCHEDYCPYAKDYRERVRDSNIIQELLAEHIIIPDAVSKAAKNLQLCPAEVMLDLAVHCDIVVGDFNYVFDPIVYLRRIFNQKDYSDWILIIDEAHNLYQRGLDYFSPQIRKAQLSDLLKTCLKQKLKIYSDLKKCLKTILNTINTLLTDAVAWHPSQQYCKVTLDLHSWEQHYADYENVFIKYLIHKIKKKIVLPDDPFETFYYTIRHFVQVARMDQKVFLPFLDAMNGGILNIQCCDPANPLGHRINGFHSVIAMSATLDPLLYYQTVLGFPSGQTEHLVLESPFPPENRKMIIIPSVSTRYSKRNQLYPDYAKIITDIIKIKRGNYLLFFPSFEFMQNVNLFLGTVNYPKLIQKPAMSATDRENMLDQLRNPGSHNLLLAVMGGIFSEGVDYLGDMCNGIIIFSPGLPKISYARDLIRDYHELNNNNGFEYAYLYPGINKVIQASGRLIRSSQDKGIVVLVGERFAEENIHDLLPQYWFQYPGNLVVTKNYIPEIKKFWHRVDPKK